MKHKAKRRRKHRAVEGSAKGIRVSSDLMGPFESEIGGHVYSMLVADGDYRWAAVGGLKSKGSQGVSERFDDLIREIKIYTDSSSRGCGVKSAY